jgi:hypothetical protein
LNARNAEETAGRKGKFFTAVEEHRSLLEGSDVECCDEAARKNVKKLIHDLVTEGETFYKFLEEEDVAKGLHVCSRTSSETLVKTSSSSSSSMDVEVNENGDKETPMEVDTNTNAQTNYTSDCRQAIMSQFDESHKSGIFTERVIVEMNHPATHIYASKTEFKPEHQRCFLSTVRKELENLRTSYAPGLKIYAFGDRYVRLSVALSYVIYKIFRLP